MAYQHGLDYIEVKTESPDKASIPVEFQFPGLHNIGTRYMLDSFTVVLFYWLVILNEVSKNYSVL